MKTNLKPIIGVFDSGVGGLSVVKAIKKAEPGTKISFQNDTKNVPYGNKGPAELYELVLPILKHMVKGGCEVIVIACNTVTTTIISELRQALPVPLIGMEPMIKPASKMTKTGVIAVFATPTTLSSPRYAELKDSYAKSIKVLEPDCSEWSAMIETNQVNKSKISNIIELACTKNADVLVLGCTHYHWIENLIKQIVGPRALVLQPEPYVINQLKKVIKDLEI